MVTALHRWATGTGATDAGVYAGHWALAFAAKVRPVECARDLPAGSRQRRVAAHRAIWSDVGYPEYGGELDRRVVDTGDGRFRERRSATATPSSATRVTYGQP
ncbi:hypothetical protein DY240_17995 [Jiangella rhizosphaerae]|uniref:Uncharacterized protein n=1 Tax=Jiangella rhizosphaerae TaxID=2293569 RepID=A0A418KN66_9ACTN|nr:hypothetical protein DY240_17995 [Jiangella rhizosphaerae]